MALFCSLQVGCDQRGSDPSSLALLAQLVGHGKGSEARMRYGPTLLPRRDGGFQIGQVPGTGVAVAQPSAQTVQQSWPLGRVGWRRLDGWLRDGDGGFQIGQVPAAGVAVAQPSAQIVQQSWPLGRVEWGRLDSLLRDGDGGFQIGQVPGANVAVAQPSAQIAQQSWPLGRV